MKIQLPQCTAFSNDNEVNSIQAAVDLYKIRAIVLTDKLATNIVGRLLKSACIPVIRVHSKLEASQKRRIITKPILVPLDKSELSELAMPYAIDLARSANAPLILLHVVPSLRNTLYTSALTAGLPWSLVADEALEAEEAVIAQDARRYLDVL